MNIDDDKFSATLKTLSLNDLFQLGLRIPEYQRSYSWQKRHVEELLKDISGRATPYLMGTVILHRTQDNNGKEYFDIVDGQQRLVTLTILWHTLQLTTNAATLSILNGKFSAGAASLIRDVQKTIKSFLDTRKDEINQLSNMLNASAGNDAHLRFYVLTLSGKNALDRAYTFFDSVNSKGIRLSDFDLLKAHHLMFIPPQQESVASTHNETWSGHQDDKRKELFSWTLRRIRMWSRVLDRDASGERPDYDEFSSVVEPALEEEVEHRFNRYMQPAAFRSWRREGGKVVLSMDYPTPDGENLLPMEVTQTIEGGDSFFLYARRYHELYETLYHASGQSTQIEFIRELAQAMGNEHLRNAFKAVMLLYADKFGEDRLMEVGICVERIVSSRRWETIRVRNEGTLTHVKNMKLVPILLESASSRHALEQLLVCSHAGKELLPVKPKDEKSSGGNYRTDAQEKYRETLADFYSTQLKRFRLSDTRIKAVAEFTIRKASVPK